jgi:hypothetical protein
MLLPSLASGLVLSLTKIPPRISEAFQSESDYKLHWFEQVVDCIMNHDIDSLLV